MSNLHKIDRFDQLEKIVAAFAAEDSPLGAILIVGAAGVGKSTLRRTIPNAYVLELATTAYGLYQEVYEHASSPIIVLDDVDTIWKDPRGLNLLKGLLQTDKVKTLQWNTKQADRDGLPRRFQTKARVLIIANTLHGAGKNFHAVVDRLIGYDFTPNAEAVHHEALSWPEGVVEPKVLKFIGEYVPFIMHPTLRDYIKGTQLFRAGLDWAEPLVSRWFEDKKLAYVYWMVRGAIAGDERFQTAAARAAHFEINRMGTRSTYFELQAKALEILGWKRVPNASWRKKHDPDFEKQKEKALADRADIEKQQTFGHTPLPQPLQNLLEAGEPSGSPEESPSPEAGIPAAAPEPAPCEPTTSESPAELVSPDKPKPSAPPVKVVRSRSPKKSKTREFPIHLPAVGMKPENVANLTDAQVNDELKALTTATFKQHGAKKRQLIAEWDMTAKREFLAEVIHSLECCMVPDATTVPASVDTPQKMSIENHDVSEKELSDTILNTEEASEVP